MNGHQEAVSGVFWADIGKPDLVMVTAAGNDDAIRVWYPSLRRPGVLRTLLGLRSGRGVVTRGRMDGRDVTVVPDRDVFLLYDPADGPPAHQVPFPAGLAGQWIFVMAWGTFDGRPILAVAGSFPVIWLIDPADGRSASVNWPGRVVSLDFRATSECGAPCVLAVGDSKGFAVVELRQPLFGTPG